MLTINAVFAGRDTGGLSTLDNQDPKAPGANFSFFATVATPAPSDLRANQASLITQADGQVYLFTLDDYSGNPDGVGNLFKVAFSGCPDKSAPLCFIKLSQTHFYTSSVVDMKRAAGTYIVATGDPTTEGIYIYALWPTKVSNTYDDGCPDGRGPYLRGLEL